jgi:hypothetical protein
MVDEKAADAGGGDHEGEDADRDDHAFPIGKAGPRLNPRTILPCRSTRAMESRHPLAT